MMSAPHWGIVDGRIGAVILLVVVHVVLPDAVGLGQLVVLRRAVGAAAEQKAAGGKILADLSALVFGSSGRSGVIGGREHHAHGHLQIGLGILGSEQVHHLGVAAIMDLRAHAVAVGVQKRAQLHVHVGNDRAVGADVVLGLGVDELLTALVQLLQRHLGLDGLVLDGVGRHLGARRRGGRFPGFRHGGTIARRSLGRAAGDAGQAQGTHAHKEAAATEHGHRAHRAHGARCGRPHRLLVPHLQRLFRFHCLLLRDRFSDGPTIRGQKSPQLCNFRYPHAKKEGSCDL